MIEVVRESWPIAGGFTISRGSKNAADVIVATLRLGDMAGRGECVPYGRYDESLDGVTRTIEGCSAWLGEHALADPAAARVELARRLPAGAARNALDCALWDLEAKLSGQSVWQRVGVAWPGSLTTAFTLSLASPVVMATKATAARGHGLLKLKLGGRERVGSAEGDIARLAAVRTARPDARLIVDANEGWRPADLRVLLEACRDHGVALVEQPLAESDDAVLAEVDRKVCICADESVRDTASLASGRLAERYDAVNIKLDKTGGLSEALALDAAARAAGLKTMVGCMVATSLAMAPALLPAVSADFVDLDGPLLLESDRRPGLGYHCDRIVEVPPALWG